MNDIVANLIRVKRVNSFQKLHCLLFLDQHPEMTGICQQLAGQLYLGVPYASPSWSGRVASVGLNAPQPLRPAKPTSPGRCGTYFTQGATCSLDPTQAPRPVF